MADACATEILMPQTGLKTWHHTELYIELSLDSMRAPVLCGYNVTSADEANFKWQKRSILSRYIQCVLLLKCELGR